MMRLRERCSYLFSKPLQHLQLLCSAQELRVARHLFLVDPVVLGLLVGVELLLLEPEVDLVLGGVDTVGAVADVAADILS